MRSIVMQIYWSYAHDVCVMYCTGYPFPQHVWYRIAPWVWQSLSGALPSCFSSTGSHGLCSPAHGDWRLSPLSQWCVLHIPSYFHIIYKFRPISTKFLHFPPIFVQFKLFCLIYVFFSFLLFWRCVRFTVVKFLSRFISFTLNVNAVMISPFLR